MNERQGSRSHEETLPFGGPWEDKRQGKAEGVIYRER